LQRAGVSYRGWVANYNAPEIFAQFGATMHVPRRPYTRQLPGIPTIRPFEALACGIPLVSAPWHDSERLFRVGTDFLMAQNGAEMTKYLRDVLQDAALAESLRQRGRETILARHTCGHRVDELLHIYDGVKPALAEVNA
jgi:spore maturation protein CgeB